MTGVTYPELFFVIIGILVGVLVGFVFGVAYAEERDRGD